MIRLLKLLCNHRIICLERDIRCDGLATEIASPLVLVALNDGLACLKGNVFDLRVVGLILVHPAPAARAYRMVQLVQFTAQNISPLKVFSLSLLFRMEWKGLTSRIGTSSTLS